MKLTTPIYRLKRQARVLSRQENLALHDALDRVAQSEGFLTWSQLAAKYSSETPAQKLYDQLDPGDLILIAARPNHGKTLLSLELSAQAMRAGHRSFVFSLDFTGRDCEELFRSIGIDLGRFADLFEFDGSDSIDASHIESRLSEVPSGTFVVFDYLQLLDQRRESPPLIDQVRSLRGLAKDRGLVLAFISQVDRSYDPSAKPFPDLSDIRLPNRLDLALFDKACFLNGDEMRIDRVS